MKAFFMLATPAAALLLLLGLAGLLRLASTN
jgi:hypothetical protein